MVNEGKNVKLNYSRTAPENFQSRDENGESTGRNHRFLPPVLRKLSFRSAKAYLLEGKSLPFTRQRIPFAGQNGEEKNNIEDFLDKRKVPENLQTSVSSEYQALSKGPQNSRI
jgi:hypothetical protein